MFVELHMIQSFAPSNLNRDDTNNPKDCEFGGVRRARISSQCIKRAVRTSPAFDRTTEVEPAQRTRRVVELLQEPLRAAGKEDDEINAVLEYFVPHYLSGLVGELDDDIRTSVMVYVSDDEIEAITEGLLENWDAMLEEDGRTRGSLVRSLVRKFKNVTSAPDIALFGRMLAQKPVLNIDAACQVAHAISTHRVKMEMDFWTAVDDLKDIKRGEGEEGDAGAGMMGFTGFNSACFYRYARIDWNQLVENLNQDTDLALRTVEGFLRAAIEAVPTGKQNAFAAHNPPGFLLAVVREDGMGWSLVNAFEQPVRPGRTSGLVAPSVEALDKYWGRLCRVYGTGTLTGVAALPLNPGLSLEHLADDQVENQETWIGLVTESLSAKEETA